MTKIAIDVVLLPPDEIMDLALQINQRAVEKGEAGIKLDKNNRIPHLSLLMGVIDEEDLTKIQPIIEEITSELRSLSLTIDAIKQQCFAIAENKQLQQLHEELIAKVDPFLSHKGSKEMYLEEPEYNFVEDFDLWVNEFINKFSHKEFFPHVTIHSPEENPVDLPIQFVASRFAICHLGARNTCRKILFETKLKEV